MQSRRKSLSKHSRITEVVVPWKIFPIDRAMAGRELLLNPKEFRDP